LEDNPFWLIPELTFTRVSFLYIVVSILLVGMNPAEVHAYEAPFYCSYAPSHESIICDVNIENLSITDVILNDGQCVSPALQLKTLDTQQDKPGSYGTYRIPSGGDFRRTYEEGDSFLVHVDPKCELKTYTIKANDKIYRFDYKPIFPF
jgi:hypothetical protein